MQPQTIDGWTIDIRDDGDVHLPIMATATHKASGSNLSRGRDIESALLDLARQIHVDRRELLALYGID